MSSATHLGLSAGSRIGSGFEGFGRPDTPAELAKLSLGPAHTSKDPARRAC